ncbi:MAG: GNAT family N-acetyltransferase [Anaerolineales bacterium]|nr:MAG: GNAT family N-acetyltransferase [Anaerolineales bacterium]
MNTNIFFGTVVRLTAEDPGVLAKAFAKWDRDTGYKRLLDDAPPIMWSVEKTKEWIEKQLEEQQANGFLYGIRTLEGDELIGFVDLWVNWLHADGWIGIGLGERDYWGNGYGTDAMQVMLRYAFTELNLHRVTLSVFEYNTRAQRSYAKAGFKLEGRVRGDLHRQGQRWDVIVMGILREEWLEHAQAEKTTN